MMMMGFLGWWGGGGCGDGGGGLRLGSALCVGVEMCRGVPFEEMGQDE